nr:RING finger protein 150-like isoform X2 [Cherax quadricarinatus]
MRVWVVLWVWVAGLAAAVTSEWSYEGATITLAHLNLSFTDPQTGHQRTYMGEVGKFGNGAVGAASGVLVVGHTALGGPPSKNNRHGCSTPWAAPPPAEPWVALVSRGHCSDREKVANSLALNASAILVYARDNHAHLQNIALSSFSRHHGVVVFLGHQQGEDLAQMVENGTKVFVSITQGQDVKYKVTNINRTSVLFVSVSFIILMVISLAWLIFYYIQRFRYIHAKDRLARHLCSAAKKALAKIPVKSIKSGDKEVSADCECCAVCIEPYQVADTVRTLPCKHEFHKNCVDPWLLDHRTCPMCKMDILKFYGYILSDSEESVLQVDVLDDTSGGEAEARLPTPPPAPANPHTTPDSQGMVVAQAEASNVNAACEAWSGSPVPDTPISPVHQPQSAATSSSIFSVISSARTRTSPFSRLSHSSQVAPSSPMTQSSNPPTPQLDTGTPVNEAENSGYICDNTNKNDIEVSSVCSEDFSDAVSTHSALGTIDVEAGMESKEPTNVNSATDCVYTVTFDEQNEAPGPCSSAPTSVPLSAQTTTPTHKRSTSRKRSSSRGRSSKRRSTSRARSTSRKRSASRTRSSSRGRSNRKQSPSHSRSVASTRSSRESHTISQINVSHV